MNYISKCAELKSASEDVKNAYRMFLRAEKRCFLSLLKNLLKPTYTSCVLDRRYGWPSASLRLSAICSQEINTLGKNTQLSLIGID